MLRRILLSPFALLWTLVLGLRHALYDTGVLHSVRPAIPTVAIGNLSFGGTGKTPHVELVLAALKRLGPIATLSRGYGRRGSEVHEVRAEDTTAQVGDEPLMLKRSHPDVRVFVGADRVAAFATIERTAPEVKAVVLDDAMQHRRLNAGLYILLTTYQRPYSRDAVVPAGHLRDLPARAKAAGIVVVTKCPAEAGDLDAERWRNRLGLRPDQRLFFSGLVHGLPRWLNGAGTVPQGPGAAALLVTGIADPAPLVAHARATWGTVRHMRFPDHHRFGPGDIDRLAEAFATFAGREKTIVTTEKDAVRLLPWTQGGALARVPIAVVPVQARILNDPDGFNALLRQHLGAHTAYG